MNRLLNGSEMSIEDLEKSGFLKILDFDGTNKRCKCEFVLPEKSDQSTQGILRACLVLEYFFIQKDCHKVQVEMIATDHASLNFYRKLGFVEEGRLSRHLLRDQKFCDVVLLAYFRETWEKKKKYLEEQLFHEGARI